MTVWAYLFRGGPRPITVTEEVLAFDGEPLIVKRSSGDQDAPVVVALHGLEGSADSPYVRRLMVAVAERGWSGVAMNARGCGAHRARGPQTYHAGHAEDVLAVVQHLADERPSRPILLVGYSLGASMVANAVFRNADRLPGEVTRAFLVALPVNLGPGSAALNHGFCRVYQLRFLRTLRRKAQEMGGLHRSVAEAGRRASEARTLRDFDDLWVAPVHGFDGADDYYQRTSVADLLDQARVRTAVLHAWDDPIVVPECVPRERLERAPLVDLLEVERGGHVGFICEGNPRWLEETILDWLGNSDAGSGAG